MNDNSQLKTQSSSTVTRGSKPDTYDSDLFVNREEERRLIQRKVEEGRYHQPIIQPLVHFWGVMGIGKSWLLQRLRQQYRFTAEGQEPDRKPTFAVLFDFGEWKISLWQPASVARFLQTLLQRIEAQLSQDRLAPIRTQLEGFDQTAEHLSTGQGEVSELAEKFVQIVNTLSRDLVPVLLFDTVENLDQDVFFWLESHLLDPILRQDRSVIVIAGRKEIPRWREFSTRQRLVKVQLQPFSKTETVQLLEKRGSLLGETVYAYTFGHPYATQVLSQATEESELVLYLARVEQRFFLGIRPEHQKILRILSTLRKFNIESSRYLLGELLGDEYKARSDVSYLRLLETLEDTHLVWWDSGQRGYVLDYTVRRILNRRLQLQDPHEFVRRHQLAWELYHRWIGDHQNCGPLIHEALYHLGQMWLGLMQLKNTDEEQKKWEQQKDELLDEVLTEEKLVTTDAANELWLSLRHDAEIQETELEPLFQPVLKRVRAFLDERAVW